MLNAKQHDREADVVTQAGRLGAVTVATNMAGRGVDILLGGNPEGLAQAELLGRRRSTVDTERSPAKYAELRRAATRSSAGREATRSRELGGLYVLGTERHESRRIDNQLRGRSGRQGDPGESRFYLSLEDELMRLFATGAMNWVMGKAPSRRRAASRRKMVTKAIERAQNTVEDRNAEIRKNVLKYDEVMNEQRKVIYARRLQILDGDDLRDEAHEDLLQPRRSSARWCSTARASSPKTWDLERLLTEMAQYYPTGFTVEDLDRGAHATDLVESLCTEALDALRRTRGCAERRRRPARRSSAR